MFGNKALWETVKFVLRLLVLTLPLTIEYVTDLGWTQAAAVLSAVLVIVDKFIHESDTKVNGIVPF